MYGTVVDDQAWRVVFGSLCPRKIKSFLLCLGSPTLPHIEEYLHWQVLKPGTQNSSQLPHISASGWSTWAIFCCLPRYISTELDWKQSSQHYLPHFWTSGSSEQSTTDWKLLKSTNIFLKVWQFSQPKSGEVKCVGCPLLSMSSCGKMNKCSLWSPFYEDTNPILKSSLQKT